MRRLTSGLRWRVQGTHVRMGDARFRSHRPVLTRKTSTVRLARGRPARRQGQFVARKVSGCLAPAVPRNKRRECIAALIPSKPRPLRFETPSFGLAQNSGYARRDTQRLHARCSLPRVHSRAEDLDSHGVNDDWRSGPAALCHRHPLPEDGQAVVDLVVQGGRRVAEAVAGLGRPDE